MRDATWFVTHVCVYSRTICGLPIGEVVTCTFSAPTCLWCAAGRSMLITRSSGFNTTTTIVKPT